MHRFALGTSVWDADGECFLNEFDVEEGEHEGTPEVEVRLDETLAEPDDVLRYCYDYGVDWSQTLGFEMVTPGTCERPRVLAGKHQAPEEDSGGIWAWNEDPDLEPLDLQDLDEELAPSGPPRAGALSRVALWLQRLSRLRRRPEPQEGAGLRRTRV